MTSPPSAQKRTPVGIGQLAITSDPEEVLVAYGLGSCIGVTAYDPVACVGGMVHVLLPDSGGKAVDKKEPARFADTGVPLLLAQLASAGAVASRLIVKVAGGAAVLGTANAEKFKIGDRNAEAIKEQLSRHGLSVAAHDLGGVKGRTLEFHVASGETLVRTAASAAAAL
jgi:chemotaxis protein CheD